MNVETPLRAFSPRPVSAAEVAGVRRPVDGAQMLPPRVFHDPEVFAFEQDQWFAHTWLCVGREVVKVETAS